MRILQTISQSIKKNGFKSAIKLVCDVVYAKRMQQIDKLPLEDKIVFECESDMDDNPRAVYEYMIEHGYNCKYKLVWIVKDVEYCRTHYKKKNVTFINRFDSTKKNQLKLRRHLSTAKVFLFSHPYWYTKIKTQQVVIHTGHGTPLKNRSEKDTDISYSFDKMLAASQHTIQWYIDFWHSEKEKLFVCGNPRNDFLLTNEREAIISKLFTCTNKDKIIMCMPTYRKSTSRVDSTVEDEFALGVIKDVRELKEFNEFLKDNKTHIIVKMHPLQLLDTQSLNSLSNIHYIVNKDLLEKNIILYKLLACCDALMTDFSSVYFDYLILNRPIAFFMNSIKQYKRGFLLKNPTEYMPGMYIYNLEDLKMFVHDLNVGVDKFIEERKRVGELVNNSIHADNTALFFDYMCKFISKEK